MNNLQIFKSEKFGALETANINGEVYFKAKNVAVALGYKRANDAILLHCRSTVKHSIPHPQSKTKSLLVNFIPEGDVIRLIAKSKLKAAREFESWIFDEVMPTILRTGSYSIQKDTDEIRVLQEIKLNNSRTRMANSCIKLANERDVKKEDRKNLLNKASAILLSDKLVDYDELI